MNINLKLVRQFHDALLLPQAEYGENVRLSDMDIVMHQALLMEEGSEVLKAVKAGDMVQILVGLINLAYCSLGAIAMRGGEVVDSPVTWRHDGSVMSVMRALSEKINQCTSGSGDNYSEVYCLCVHLTRSFINADFDKAFQMVHDFKMAHLLESTGGIRKLNPDLSECLYE